MQTVIDNFGQLLPLMSEDSSNLYYVEIIRRRKDNPDDEEMKESTVIKSYLFKRPKSLLEKKNEIVGLCKFFNGRAYIRMTPVSKKKVLKNVLHNFTDVIGTPDEDFNPVSRFWSSVGTGLDSSKKLWVIDCDDFSEEQCKALMKEIQKLHILTGRLDSYPTNGVITKEVLAESLVHLVKTPNAFHILTVPFDQALLREKTGGLNLDVKKDGNTVLWAQTS